MPLEYTAQLMIPLEANKLLDTSPCQKSTSIYYDASMVGPYFEKMVEPYWEMSNLRI